MPNSTHKIVLILHLCLMKIELLSLVLIENVAGRGILGPLGSTTCLASIHPVPPPEPLLYELLYEIHTGVLSVAHRYRDENLLPGCPPICCHHNPPC